MFGWTLLSKRFLASFMKFATIEASGIILWDEIYTKCIETCRIEKSRKRSFVNDSKIEKKNLDIPSFTNTWTPTWQKDLRRENLVTNCLGNRLLLINLICVLTATTFQNKCSDLVYLKDQNNFKKIVLIKDIFTVFFFIKPAAYKFLLIFSWVKNKNIGTDVQVWDGCGTRHSLLWF